MEFAPPKPNELMEALRRLRRPRIALLGELSWGQVLVCAKERKRGKRREDASKHVIPLVLSNSASILWLSFKAGIRRYNTPF